MKAPPNKAAAPAETGTAERNKERIHCASQPAKGKQQIHKPFIPAWLDDAGLSAADFRLYCHLCRRADNQTGIAFPAAESMAEACKASLRSIWRSIKELERRGFIKRMGKPFMGANRYLVTVPPDLANRAKTAPIVDDSIVPPEQRLNASQPCQKRTANRAKTAPPIVPPEHHKGIPLKGIHLRESNTYQLPFDSDAFKAAWQDWQDYRKEIKKPVTGTSAKTHFKKFTQWGEQRTITAIESSIRNGWQGVFEPRCTNTPAKPQAAVNTELRPAIIEEI